MMAKVGGQGITMVVQRPLAEQKVKQWLSNGVRDSVGPNDDD